MLGAARDSRVRFCQLVKGCLFLSPSQGHTLPSQGAWGCIGRAVWSPKDDKKEERVGLLVL